MRKPSFLIFVAVSLGTALCGFGQEKPMPFQGLNPTNCVQFDPFLTDYIAMGATVVYSARASERGSVLEGPFKIISVTGLNLVQGTYSNGMWQGELLTFHTNGAVSSRQLYKNGKNVGVEIYFWPSGEPWRTTHYKGGLKDGLEVYSSVDGSLLSRTKWEAGDPIWIELFESGKTNRLSGSEAKQYFKEKALEAAKELREK